MPQRSAVPNCSLLKLMPIKRTNLLERNHVHENTGISIWEWNRLRNANKMAPARDADLGSQHRKLEGIVQQLHA
jgi:hypothetical protein